MFGMSFIYIIFKDNVEFYWSRSRILEKTKSLPSEHYLPECSLLLGLMQRLLVRFFWYTLRDAIRKPESQMAVGILQNSKPFRILCQIQPVSR